MSNNFFKPQFYINRELSWLEFNRRVLEEAEDLTQPLLERLRFLCIVSSNLDEFFEVRVAGIKQQMENELSDTGPDGMSSPQIFEAIRQKALDQKALQHKIWAGELQPALEKHNVAVFSVKNLNSKDQAWAAEYFRKEVYPVLTPLAVDASHPFPQLRSRSHNLILLLRHPKQPHDLSYGVVQIPNVLPRLVRLPRPGQELHAFHYFLLQDLIQHHVGELFPGLRVQSACPFRITRNTNLYIDEEEAANLLRTIEEELRKRNRGNAIRLELPSDCSQEIQALLLDIFKLTPADLYLIPGPVNFLHLLPLCSIDSLPELRDKPFIPATSRALQPESDIFEVLRRQDVLLHHPYESFESIVEFVQKAAHDPHVLAIKMTLYRTSGDSAIVRSLIEAARNGKQVTALLELRARFDEANNISWAKQMEEAGIHVVYGVVGLKIHCKMLLVVRRDDDRIRHYVHLGTGNYHSSTARIYTDLSLLTAKTDLAEEVATLFNTLTGLSDFGGFKKLLVAPYELDERTAQLIRAERDFALAGKPGRIIAKINALVDEDIIQALYDASCAGVKIDLIVRGICCLRPGLSGISDNIRVVSIVGRFLEHSRIFYFGNNGDPKVYLGSADWMPRNLYRRIEVLFPVEDPALRARITDEILPTYLADRVKARELQSDGSYRRLQPLPDAKPVKSQLAFRELAYRQNAISDRETPSPVNGKDTHSTDRPVLAPL